MNKKNLLFIISSMYNGGAEKTLLELLKNLDPNKYNVTLLLVTYEGVYLDYIPQYVTIKYIFNKSKNKYIGRIINSIRYRYWLKLMLKYPILIHKFILRKSYDYEISFTEGLPFKLLLAETRAYKVTRLCTNFAHHHPDITPGHVTEMKVYGHDFVKPTAIAAAIWCISATQAEILTKFFPLYKEKIRFIPNFRNMNEIIKLSDEFQISYERNAIIAVGRLEKEKRFDILIRAFAMLKNKDWCLKIIGMGSEFNSLQQLTSELNLNDNVEFLGFKINPYPYLKSASIFTLTSDYEGFANVLIEALVLEIPIVATNCNVGPKEILANGEYGILTPIGDHINLAKNIQLLIEDQQIYNKFKKKSRL